VVDHKLAELQPLASVQADIEKRLAREQALKLAAADGAAKLKDLQAGKDLGFKWPTPLAVNRQKSGGLMPDVMEGIFRADTKKLPVYVGVDTPAGYSLVQVSKVNEPAAIDDAKRKALGDRLRDATGAEEFDAALGSLRDRIGVSVSKDALAKSTTAGAEQ